MLFRPGKEAQSRHPEAGQWTQTSHACFHPYPVLVRVLRVRLLTPRASWGRLVAGSQRAGRLWTNLWAPPGPGVQAVSSPGREDRFPGFVGCRQRGLRKPVRAADGRGNRGFPLCPSCLSRAQMCRCGWDGVYSGEALAPRSPPWAPFQLLPSAGARRSGPCSFQRPSRAEPG